MAKPSQFLPPDPSMMQMPGGGGAPNIAAMLGGAAGKAPKGAPAPKVKKPKKAPMASEPFQKFVH